MFSPSNIRPLRCLYAKRAAFLNAKKLSVRAAGQKEYCQKTEQNNHENAKSGNHQTGRKHADTFSQEEINKFAKLGGQWWDLDGPLKALHSMNELRVPFIVNGLLNARGGARSKGNPTPLEGLKVLEVGCGGGILCEPLARLGAEVTGLDVTPEGIAAAKAHAPLSLPLGCTPHYLCTSLEQHLEEGGGPYDGVVASEVLEHVADLDAFLSLLCSCVAPGGVLALTSIDRTPQSLLGAVLLAEYLLGLLPRGTHDWRAFVPLESLREGVQSRGLRVETVHGMCYDPLRDAWAWSRDVSVNYALRAVKPRLQASGDV